MSVPKNKRTEGELAVITKARDLRLYTLKICSNENNFPKRYRWCLTNNIVSMVNDITDLIISANAVKVDFTQDKYRRLERQKTALELTESLLDNISVAYELFQLKSNSVEYWTRKVDDVQKLLRAWIRSDTERYKNI